MFLKLESSVIARCEDFASTVDVSHYKSRGQSDASKCRKDSLIGKLGEFIAFQFLQRVGEIGLSEPDLQIYTKKEKRYGYDLTSASNNFHVKSALGVDTSWVFEKSDSHILRPRINDYVVFVRVLAGYHIGEVVACTTVTKIHLFGLFKPLRKTALITKSAVYEADLRGLNKKAS